MGIFKRNGANGATRPIKARIAFFDQPAPYGQLEETWPTMQFIFENQIFSSIEAIKAYYYTPFIENSDGTNNAIEVIDSLESLVNEAHEEGYNINFINGSSTFLQPWIDAVGVGSFLEHNLCVRHPKEIFILPKLTSTGKNIMAPNIWKLADTNNYPEIYEDNLKNFYLGRIPTGQVLAIVQQDDVASNDALAKYLSVAKTIGINIKQNFLVFDTINNQFTMDSINQALLDIQKLPPNSLVLLAVNSAQPCQDALTSQIFIDHTLPEGYDPTDNSSNANVAYLGINYRPCTIPNPYVILLGEVTTTASYLAPMFYNPNFVSPPFNSNPKTSEQRNPLFIEGMALASSIVNCTPFHGTDGLSRFDSFHEYVAPFVAQQFIQPGHFQNTTIPGTIFENPRWTVTLPIHTSQVAITPYRY